MSDTAAITPPPLPKALNGSFCSSCGNPINIKTEICPSCGIRQRKGADKTALALLAFFLGGLGGHKFYIGKYGQGVLYLLFCWTGIPGLVALIEFIIYLCTPSEEIAQKYTSKGPGVVIAFVVCIFGFIFMIGILAAIAIPNFIAYRNKATCVHVETVANTTVAALSDFYADSGLTHVPTYSELVNATGLQPNDNISVRLEGKPGETLIQVYHNTGTCPKGESFVVFIDDEVIGEWQ